MHFDNDVHFHMKGQYTAPGQFVKFYLHTFTGSRDPYDLKGRGAGFALCWKGNPKLLIGQQNVQDELVQVISDTMLIIVPK